MIAFQYGYKKCNKFAIRESSCLWTDQSLSAIQETVGNLLILFDFLFIFLYDVVINRVCVCFKRSAWWYPMFCLFLTNMLTSIFSVAKSCSLFFCAIKLLCCPKNTSVRHTVVLGDTFLPYHEHTCCILLWVNHIYTQCMLINHWK